MKYLKLEKKINIFLNEPFKKPFDGALMVYNPDEVEDVLTPRNASSFLQEALDFSWDGALYWMPNNLARVFLSFAEVWFEDNYKKMKSDMDEGGLSNVLLISKTNNGYAFIDTQVDINSEIPRLLSEFEIEYGNEFDFQSLIIIEDSHLVDNLVFGRHICINEDAQLKQLYEEGLLISKVALMGQEETYQKIIDSKKTIVLTGDFGDELLEIIGDLSMFFPVSDKIESENCWLWLGDNPNSRLINEAENLNVKISTMSEVMEYLIINE